MKKISIFCMLAALAALSAQAQDLTNANSAVQAMVQSSVDPLKALAALHLKTMQLPAQSPTVAYALDTIKKVDAGSGKTIKITSYVSNCPEAELPFAIDARRLAATWAVTPGGAKPLVVAGVLTTWDRGHGACGGVAMPADFKVANPIPKTVPQVDVAGGDYALAEVDRAKLLPTSSPVPEISLVFLVRANEQLAGPFLIDATKQNGGKPTVIVGAIVFSPKLQPGVAIPSFMRAVRLVARSPIGGANLEIRAARP